MKIFNRGTDAKPATAAQAAVAPPAPAPAGPAAAKAAPPPAAAPPAAPPAPAQAPAPAPPPAAAAPDISVILDANVKEMSEKIARLASSLESSQSERGSFEAKLEQMEERMRKLSSLTEMISAQYNPFVGDAPAEREPLPHPEVGLAAPPMPAQAAPPPTFVEPEAAPTLSLSLAPPEPAPMAMPEPEPAYAAPEPEYAPFPHPAQAAAPAQALPAEPGVYVWHVQPGFESSMLLLGWADMLLKSAGSRESLLDLVNYYHNIGWIGDPARDQLLAYADGLATPTGSAPIDWRANVEVHEKSLLFVEKLRALADRRSR